MEVIKTSRRIIELHSMLLDGDEQVKIMDIALIERQRERFMTYKIRRIQTWILNMFGYNSMAIYWPRTKKGMKFKIPWVLKYIKPQLEPSQSDQMWRRIMDVTVAILLIRLTVTSIITAAILKTSEYPDERLVSPIWRKSSWDAASRIWGDPLSTLPRSTFLIHTAVTGLLYYFCWHLRLKHINLMPLNSLSLRFIRDPKREIRRCQLQQRRYINELLKELTVSVVKKISIATTIKRKVSPETLGHYLKLLPCNHCNIAPVSYSVVFHEFLSILSMITFVVGLLVYIPFNLEAHFELIAILGGFTCAKNDLTKVYHCSLSETITLSDLIGCIDITVAVYFLEICILISFGIMVLTGASQLYTVSNQIQQIKHLRLIIKKTVILIEMDQLGENFHPDRSQNTTLNRLLFENFIRILMIRDDIIQNAITLSEMAASTISLSLITMTVSFRAMRWCEFRSPPFWILFMTLNWLGINVVVSACAYVLVRTQELEKIACCLLADLSHLEISSPNSNQVTRFLASKWRRLVVNNALSDRQIVVSPFGIGLNYKRVLEMNFLLISIASLTGLLNSE